MAEEKPEERLEDVFHEIEKRFHSSESFAKFARSKDGLKLSQHDVSTIKEDHSHRQEQNIQMLFKWAEVEGVKATASAIREKVDWYFGQERGTPSGDEEPEPMQIQHVSSGPTGQNITITNVYGGMHGPLFIGNQNVATEGGKIQQGGEPPLDPDLPQLKKTNSVILAENKSSSAIGNCLLKFPAHSVREETAVDLYYQIVPAVPPEGHVRASATLSCSPAFHGIKDAKIKFPTWCVTKKSVDVGIYCLNDEGWNELDHPVLTHEGHLELHYRSLDNITAYISTTRLEDVQFRVSCFLFNNADGRFAMAFCLKDAAIENIMQHKLKKEGFVSTISGLTFLTTSLRDEIRFKISPGQQMQNTKLDIDEDFVSSYTGHISYCKLDKSSSSPEYIIQHMSPNKTGTLEEVVNNKYRIDGKEGATRKKRGCRLEIRGSIEADNYMGGADLVNIDQRSFHSEGEAEGCNSKPFWDRKDKISYDPKKSEKKKELPRASQSDDDASPRVLIEGSLKARNVITSAKTVNIDQRRIRKSKGSKRRSGQQEPQVERIVEPMQPAGEEQRPGTVEEDVLLFVQPEEAENRAKPFIEEDEKPGDEGKVDPVTSDEKAQSINAGKKSEESGVRKRKGDSRKESKTEPSEQPAEDSGSQFDGYHVFLGVCLLFFALFTWYNYTK